MTPCFGRLRNFTFELAALGLLAMNDTPSPSHLLAFHEDFSRRKLTITKYVAREVSHTHVSSRCHGRCDPWSECVVGGSVRGATMALADGFATGADD
jgi:hypothetical protein